MISGNADATNFRRVGRRTGLFPILPTTTTLPNLSRDLVIAVGSIYIALDWIDSPNWPACCGIPEDAEHAMFYCPWFIMERRSPNQAVGSNVTPESILAEMLKSKKNWLMVFSIEL